jgi:hypothetical protein
MYVREEVKIALSPNRYCIEETNKDYLKKSINGEKGYVWELKTQLRLDLKGIAYEGNPLEWEDWNKKTLPGYDIKIKDLNIKIECKYLSKPIYNSWFYRDWMSRDADIFVTPDPYLLSYNQRREMARSHKKLLSLDEFIIYILKKLRRLSLKGNKYNLNNISPMPSDNKKSFKSKERFEEDSKSRSSEIKNIENKWNMSGDYESSKYYISNESRIKIEEKEELDNLRHTKGITKEQFDRMLELEYKENNPKPRDTQTTLVHYSKAGRLKAHIQGLIPSCNNCTRKIDCDILKTKEKLKCLKKRTFQLTRGYNTFNIDIKDSLFDIALSIFWEEIKEKENNLYLNSGDKH